MRWNQPEPIPWISGGGIAIFNPISAIYNLSAGMDSEVEW